MSFKSTRDYPSSELVQTLEKLGGNVMAHSSRENMAFQATVFPNDLEKITELFAQIIRYPSITEQELEETKFSTQYEIADIDQNLEMKLPETLHAIAFTSDNGQCDGLGLGALCNLQDLERLSTKSLQKFRNIWYTPENIVVAGVGMEHDRLTDLTNK
ncbi:Mitochondrial-processing peptidase subunit alpha [Nowakowskiella sp. JEL0078]|nr:Mitochondrial-processing peptidase subunit alpha [Nowakowskiella sp. JEL0078]